MNLKELVKTKTFWTGLAGIAAALLGIFHVLNPDVSKIIDTVCAFLIVVFVRDGMISGPPNGGYGGNG